MVLSVQVWNMIDRFWLFKIVKQRTIFQCVWMWLCGVLLKHSPISGISIYLGSGGEQINIGNSNLIKAEWVENLFGFSHNKKTYQLSSICSFPYSSSYPSHPSVNSDASLNVVRANSRNSRLGRGILIGSASDDDVCWCGWAIGIVHGDVYGSHRCCCSALPQSHSVCPFNELMGLIFFLIICKPEVCWPKVCTDHRGPPAIGE